MEAIRLCVYFIALLAALTLIALLSAVVTSAQVIIPIFGQT
ncbi:MAG: hypothetical protein ACRD6N_06605 [Pyrinomonadaceae bacterium]